MSHEARQENDPFREARRERGVMRCEFQGERIPMILRHADVRAAAKEWKRYTSDTPFRVVIPSEEAVRSMRQLPIETDPPEHTEYRALVEPFFQRAKEPAVIEAVEALIERELRRALDGGSIEIVRDFALPIQSLALTHLLNVPESEAAIWTGWGIHVFRDGEDGSKKGAVLEEYLQRKFDEAEDGDGEDFFSALTQAEFRGRRLTREEMMGFANLTFAGGRDTIIQSIASVIAYLAEHPEALAMMRGDSKAIIHASEEFFRMVTPLTHIGRTCPVDREVIGEAVPAGGRISLCWASANRDEAVFEDPYEVKLDRKPNPHVAFGFGPHLCLGAPHSRLVIRSLLAKLAALVDGIEPLEAERNVEEEEKYRREVGFQKLVVRFLARG